MNILNELTVKNLKRNKKRTLVTIFGIILSVALVTAITTFVSSMQGSMIEYAKKNDGDYHIFVSDVPVEQQKYLLNNAKIEQTMIGQTIADVAPETFFKEEEDQENHRGMLKLKAFEEKDLKRLGIKLIEGRMPKNEQEILLPMQLSGLDGISYMCIRDRTRGKAYDCQSSQPDLLSTDRYFERRFEAEYGGESRTGSCE